MGDILPSPLHMMNVSESILVTRLLQLRLLGVTTSSHSLFDKISKHTEEGHLIYKALKNCIEEIQVRRPDRNTKLLPIIHFWEPVEGSGWADDDFGTLVFSNIFTTSYLVVDIIMSPDKNYNYIERVKSRANLVFNILSFINYHPQIVEYAVIPAGAKLPEKFNFIDSSTATGVSTLPKGLTSKIMDIIKSDPTSFKNWKQEEETKTLDPAKNKRCSVCNTETTDRCGACSTVYYCSRDCQRKDWSKHKLVCKKK